MTPILSKAILPQGLTRGNPLNPYIVDQQLYRPLKGRGPLIHILSRAISLPLPLVGRLRFGLGL